jgi:hypothetical protein
LPQNIKKWTLKPIVKIGYDKQNIANASTSPALRLEVISVDEASSQNALAIPINKIVQTKPMIKPGGNRFGPSVKRVSSPSHPISAIRPLITMVTVIKTVTHISQFFKFLSKLNFSMSCSKIF